MTDLEEREANEERQRMFVNLCLLRQRVSDRNRHAEQHEELWEGVSPLILLYSVVAIALQYSYSRH